MTATVILGDVFTCDPRVPRAAAVGLEGGRIRAVGDEARVRSAVGRDARLIDAGGRTVLPGLIDAHNHYWPPPSRWPASTPASRRSPTRAGLVDAVGEAAERTPDGRWIRGVRAWITPSSRASGRPPGRSSTTATSVHPVVVYHVSGHWALVNSAALRGARHHRRRPATRPAARSSATRRGA